jgi:ADP-ribose pyrophosphatase YjhB (NUDIX family)
VSILLARRHPSKPTSYALVKRKNPPKQGQWSFPGGVVDLGTTQLEQSYTEIEEELGIKRDQILWLQQPLGCKDVIIKEKEKEDDHEKISFHYTVSQLFAELIGNDDSLEAGDDAAEAAWWSKEDFLSAKNTTLTDGTTEAVERLELLMNSGQDFLRLQAPDLPPPPTEALVEVKKKMSGEEQRFNLELWQWDAANEIVVGRWQAPTGGAYAGLKEGSYSWGVWGRGVFGEIGVGAYRMHEKDGSLKGYRFDVLAGATMETMKALGSEEKERVLTFDDLLLDGLVTRRLTNEEGAHLELLVEDEDEVVAWQQSLSKEQVQTIDAARDALQGQESLHRLVGSVDDAIAAGVRARRTAHQCQPTAS